MDSEKKVAISIVVLTYFHEKYIERALDSILSQKFDQPYEIYIADDCSKDDTLAICEKYRTKYPDLISIHSNETNQGICKNVIEAIQSRKGKYVMITDGDDYWTDDEKLKKQYYFLENNYDYVAVATALESRDVDGKKYGDVLPKQKYRNREITRKMFLNGVFLCYASMLMRNIFSEKAAVEQFNNIMRFSRDLDDAPFCVFIFDYGKVYNMGDVTYAVTHRREDDVDQHNYNTKYNVIQKEINRIEVYTKVSDYYNGTLNMTHKYETSILSLIKYYCKTKDKKVLTTIKKVPLSYIIKAIIRYPFRRIGIIEE